MEKKFYERPEMKAIEIHSEAMIATSPNVVNSDWEDDNAWDEL